MVNVTIENMAIKSRPKNLLQQEKENTPQEETPSTPQSLSSYLDQLGIEWEQKGRAYYVYPSSLETVKKVIEKMPLPQPDQYIIIPLGNVQGYSVFIMITNRSTSIRLGYGRNSIPFSPILSEIVPKVAKVSKEVGIENAKGGKNLLE